MGSQTMKAHIIDNVIVTMSRYIDEEALRLLERALSEELVKVTVEEITTLPANIKSSIDEQNAYILQLFIYKKKNLATATKYAYLNTVKRLITVVYKPLTLMEEIDVYHYLDWYANRNVAETGRKNQASTVNNERRFLSAFFTWLRKEKLIPSNPVEAVEPLKVFRKPIDYFTAEEIAKLRDGCRTLRERALVEVLRSTGARVGEIVVITVDMIDWATGDILILGEKGGGYRTIYLDPEALYHYHKYLNSRTDHNPAIFVGSREPHRAMSRDAIRLSLKGIAKRAGVNTRVYPHKLRKTLGMNLKNRGVDIGMIQEILGHAGPDVTAAYYAQSTPESLRQVREKAAA